VVRGPMALCRLAAYRDGQEGLAKVCVNGVWNARLSPRPACGRSAIRFIWTLLPIEGGV